MRAATVVWRYHTTTRRAARAAIAHARAERTSPRPGSVHSRHWTSTAIAADGAIQSRAICTRSAAAEAGSRQRASAALSISVHVQSAAM